MIIDTEYDSLAQIDTEIVRLYAEDTRQDITGYDDDSNPIYGDPYVVITHTVPEEVYYTDVERVKGERKSWATQKLMIDASALREDYDVNHTGYLSWKDAHATWTTEQPTQPALDENGQKQYDDDGNLIMEVVPAPVRPTIDMSIRRKHYLTTMSDVPSGLIYSECSYAYDDENCTCAITPIMEVSDSSTITNDVIAAINAKKTTLIESGVVVHDGRNYGMGEVEERNAAGMSTLANAIISGNMDSSAWPAQPIIDYDNNFVSLTPAEYLAYAAALMTATQAKVNAARTHKDAVLALAASATTVNDWIAVANYDYSTGW